MVKGSELLIYEQRLRPIGGNQRYIALVLQHIGRWGIKPLLVTPSYGELNALIQSVDTTELLAAGPQSPSYVVRCWRLFRLLSRHRPCVLMCNNYQSVLSGVLPAFLARVPVVWFVKVTRRTKWVDPLLLLLTARVLAITPRVFDYKSRGLKPWFHRRAIHLPIGIDLVPFLDIAAPEPGSGLRVLMLARLTPPKGVHLIVEAIERLGENAKDIYVSVYGGTPAGQEHYAAALQDRVTRLKYRNVALCGWHDDVKTLLQNADAVALTSRSEGTPRSLLEAMTAARPTLATKVGNVPELLTHGVTGIMVEVDDVDNIAAQLVWLREHPQERIAMGLRAREYVQQHYSIDTHMAQLADIISGCLPNAAQS